MEYLDRFTSDSDADIITEDELGRLAWEWDLPKETLLDMVEEVSEDVAEFLVNWDVTVNMMDEDLREEVHADLAPCSKESFMKEYLRRHYRKFGEDFSL